MNFLDRIFNRMKLSPESFPHLMKWIAENQSRQPATVTRSWLPHVRAAREAEVALFLGLFIEPWETWELVERIRDLCYYQRYNGEWEKVQAMLEQITDLQSFEDSFQKNQFMSPDEFFGNFLGLCERFLRRNPSAFKSPVRDRRKPRKLVYRRGYRDKGSLRPYHQRGRNLGEESPGEDRRRKVQYAHLPSS